MADEKAAMADMKESAISSSPSQPTITAYEADVGIVRAPTVMLSAVAAVSSP